MKLLDGKKLSEKILADLKGEIKKNNLKLALAVVLVGNNSISKIYIKQKENACKKIGAGFRLFKFSENIKANELKKGIEQIVQDPDNSGIIIQLPLPKNIINTQEILDIIPAEKDVDVLSEKSLGKLYTGELKILPPVVCGISHFFDINNINIKGKNILLVGTGKLVGKPLMLWFLRKEAAVSVVNKFTKDISVFAKNADVIISGAGVPKLIKGSMVKQGLVAIDAGTVIEKGKLAGDIDFESVSEKASYITPLPGGVGPMTVACLLENLVKLNQKK
ncbi:MAG: bifunctional 5,10-methylenetetrahydrofolate dehydrogenase/5,10-methenyltetrahydrofolate cyclohydrolase [Candidatus Pacebacteria bacterium]|nr:bifunctional 5,10-methylenetetrahydrofolate dehydrogenase/5,10-methenyltetrahydrofolate cyclohydrolase [Candidatus Paceibacterota bacterium]